MFNMSNLVSGSIFGNSNLSSALNMGGQALGALGGIAGAINGLTGSVQQDNSAENTLKQQYAERTKDLQREGALMRGRARARSLKSGFAYSGSAADVLSSRTQTLQKEQERMNNDLNRRMKNLDRQKQASGGSGGGIFGNLQNLAGSVVELSDLFKGGDWDRAKKPRGVKLPTHTTLPSHEPSYGGTPPWGSGGIMGDYEGPIFESWKNGNMKFPDLF
ncbi:MAG: hypothetical protein ACNI27_03765 [Desulfovibrio sp.]